MRWRKRSEPSGEDWYRLIPPTYPADAPAPETPKDVEAALMSVIFLAQGAEGFPRCGAATPQGMGLPGHGVVLHFDHRLEEDDAFHIEITRKRIPPGRETPIGRQWPPSGEESREQ
jgi:hypothetical protein